MPRGILHWVGAPIGVPTDLFFGTEVMLVVDQALVQHLMRATWAAAAALARLPVFATYYVIFDHQPLHNIQFFSTLLQIRPPANN